MSWIFPTPSSIDDDNDDDDDNRVHNNFGILFQDTSITPEHILGPVRLQASHVHFDRSYIYMVWSNQQQGQRCHHLSPYTRQQGPALQVVNGPIETRKTDQTTRSVFPGRSASVVTRIDTDPNQEHSVYHCWSVLEVWRMLFSPQPSKCFGSSGSH